MEILYLYIKDYKSIKNQNINFGSEYVFEFDGRAKLTETNNQSYIKGFYNVRYEDANVANVTSIIGENGTGKSSILNFIKENFASGSNLQHEAILVLRENGEIVIYTTYPGLTYNEAIFKCQFVKNPHEGEVFNFGYDFRGIDNTDIIFFSNIFDGTPGGSISGLYDISVNGLIYEDYKLEIEQGISNKDQNQIGVFLTKDIFRQLQFIYSDISNERVPYRVPETLSIIISENLNSFRKDTIEFTTFEKFKDAILRNYFYDHLGQEDGTTQTGFNPINAIICSVLLNVVKELLTRNSATEQIGFKFSPSITLTERNTIVSFMDISQKVEHFFNEIHLQLKGLKMPYPQLMVLIDDNKKFINYLLENSVFFYNDFFDETNQVLNFNIFSDGESNELILKEFFNLYVRTFSVNPYLKFRWRNLSTGENALLNIFSRFYSLSNEQKFGEALNNNLLILIDEGDTYLHPAWQKKLLKNLLEFLPIIFKFDRHGNLRNIQLVFTTNSPIPASDLLSYNTIFLEKVTNSTNSYTVQIKDGLNEQKQTFAANIHSLLADSFFVNNGLRGDFANDKLQELIKFLKEDNKDTIFSEETALKLINLIGEPLIKNSLKDLYFERYSSAIQTEIDRLTALKEKYDSN